MTIKVGRVSLRGEIKYRKDLIKIPSGHLKGKDRKDIVYIDETGTNSRTFFLLYKYHPNNIIVK